MAKYLVIVESPAKARTIAPFLGKDYKVEASIGHIRDLPGSAAEIPAAYKKEKWARIGVDVDHDFKPLYIVPDEKKKQVKKLKDALKGVEFVYLATDEDREGESISWHLLEVLKPKVKLARLVFHEITKDAILESLKNPRQVDMNMVHAQETRRVLDRLYGYEISPLLWRKIAPKLSAGRVQSVAIRLVVERERTRQKFVAAEYFDLIATFATEKQEKFNAELREIDGKKIALGKDFDYETGKLKNAKTILLSGKDAEELKMSIEKQQFKVKSLETKPYKRSPGAPFTTSTLQQEAARKLKYAARRTMQVAQRLYENGYITYMRTDSVALSETAVKAARAQASDLYGKEYITAAPRHYASKVKNAQEAHEAIRPAGTSFRLPEEVRGELEAEQFALYDLIWKRTIASQMEDAQLIQTSVQVWDEKHTFTTSGKQIKFAGFLKAYVEGSDDPEEDLADQEKILPPLVAAQKLDVDKMDTKGHQTKAVARYTEASLIKELEARGIGRPSTYASIMDTIVRREYVFKQGGALVPTFMAFAVVKLMEQYFTKLVDYDFTAEMEEHLDEIALGKMKPVPYLQQFYFGNAKHEGLTTLLQQDIDAREACTLVLGKDSNGHEIRLRIGKFGPFLESDENKKASLPEGFAPDELNLERAMQILEDNSGGPVELGIHPEDGKKIFKGVGRFGPFVQLGEKAPPPPKDEEKPKVKGKKKEVVEKVKFKSIPAFLKIEDVDLGIALKLLSLPKSLGKNAEGEDIYVDIGRYGPYLKAGTKNRSIPETYQVLDLTLEQALEIFATEQAPSAGRGGFARKAPATAPLKVLNEKIKVLTGRYGPYITDGKVNVSVPKDIEVADLTLEQATDMLAKKKKK